MNISASTICRSRTGLHLADFIFEGECLRHAKTFIDATANVCIVNSYVADTAFGIDDEGSTLCNALFFQQNAIIAGYPASKEGREPCTLSE